MKGAKSFAIIGISHRVFREAIKIDGLRKVFTRATDLFFFARTLISACEQIESKPSCCLTDEGDTSVSLSSVCMFCELRPLRPARHVFDGNYFSIKLIWQPVQERWGDPIPTRRSAFSSPFHSINSAGARFVCMCGWQEIDFHVWIYCFHGCEAASEKNAKSKDTNDFAQIVRCMHLPSNWH